LLAPRPIFKLEDRPLPAVSDYLFNIFAATRADINIDRQLTV